jgi:hypothetical protein
MKATTPGSRSGGRVDTTAEAEAAEDLTVAELSFRGVVAGKYPRNWPSSDVFVFDKARKDVVDIQVKYRHKASASSVDVGDFGADFLVVVRANMGVPTGGRSGRQIWVVPMAIVAERWPSGRVPIAQIDDTCLGAWDVIVMKATGEGDG